MRVLITGVQGFIGSHLARLLLRQGHSVVGVARSHSSMGTARLVDISRNPRFSLRHVDLALSASGVTEGMDRVFHLAAATFVDHSIRDPAHFVRNNYLASFHLLEDARQTGVQRVVQISTDEVYGPIQEGVFAEGSPLVPSNPYSATKGAADLLISAYHTTYGLSGLIVRLSNVFGSWQHPQKVIPTFVKHAFTDQPLPVFGDGQHRRSWLAVDDACRGLCMIGESGESGGVYHLAGKGDVTNQQLGRMVLDVMGKPTDRMRYIPDRDARPGHDRRYALGTDRAEALGWSPLRHLESELPRVVRWYARRPAWLGL